MIWIDVLILTILTLASIKIINGEEISLLIPETLDLEPEKIIKEVLEKASIKHNSKEDPLKNCPVTAQFELTSSGRLWRLKSIDRRGQKKLMGGDELYVTYNSPSNKSPHPTAVAKITDDQNGWYSLRFISTPMHPEFIEKMYKEEGEDGGTLTLYYSYSCRMAEIPAPEKNGWINGGFVNKKYQVEVSQRPFIVKFEPPSLPASLKGFDHVLGIGDSMMRHFAGEWRMGEFVRSNGSYTKRFSNPLNSITVEYYLDKIRWDISEEFKNNPVLQKKSASLLVVLGSGVWDVVEDNEKRNHGLAHNRTEFYSLDKKYSDHRKGFRMLIDAINQEYADDTNIQFAWKSNTACHPHRIPNDSPEVMYRTRYTTVARSKRLYIVQKTLANIYKVPFLDIFEASYLSADYHYDTSHFYPEFNELTWNWFFPQ